MREILPFFPKLGRSPRLVTVRIVAALAILVVLRLPVAGDGMGSSADARPLQDERVHTLLAEGKRLIYEAQRLHDYEGNYDAALAVAERGLAVTEEATGPDHLQVAPFLVVIAIMHTARGDYTKGEQFLERARSIYAKTIGVDHVVATQVDKQLATLYLHRGDYERAAGLLAGVLETFERAVGADHAYVGAVAHVLATAYAALGHDKEAEALFVRALAISEKHYREERIERLTALHQLALFYMGTGNHAAGEPLLRRGLAIQERGLGADHPLVAATLENLATIHTVRGEYAAAEALIRRGLGIRERSLGTSHPDVAASLYQLAGLREQTGAFGEAITLRTRAAEINERNIATTLTVGSELQKERYLHTFVSESDAIYSLPLRVGQERPEALRLALTTALRRKGRVLDVTAENVRALRGRLDEGGKVLFDELASSRSRLAHLTLAGGDSPEALRYTRNLSARVEELEAEIGKRNLAFRQELTPVTLDGVCEAVPPDSALVEYVAFGRPDRRGPRATRSAARFAAFVLQHDSEPQWVDLGEADAVERDVVALRAALRSPKRTDVLRHARALDARVMAPVRALVKNRTRLMLSPDGALNLVPFAALVDEQGRYLVERFTITYLTSGRDLLRFERRVASRQPTTIIANPNFGPTTAGRARSRELKHGGSTEAATGSTAGLLARAYFPPIAGTEAEARALKAVLPDARVLTGNAATKEALMQVAAPRILHIATHGFFIENAPAPSDMPAVRDGAMSASGARGPVATPLARSGLALAGANLRRSDGDGIVTGLEIAGLDLWGTRLVVLSACDTGVGEVKNGEGVFGLRRALVLAGAETTMLSLWPVSDAGTRDLMASFYGKLLTGTAQDDALRESQLEMLHNPKRRHPFFWASFVQTGSWKPLAPDVSLRP
jgi:CHAT domain-containing protein/tetratricopeptide (TPR) repeat protein